MEHRLLVCGYGLSILAAAPGIIRPYSDNWDGGLRCGWCPTGPHTNLAGAQVLSVCVGWSGRSENTLSARFNHSIGMNK